MTKYETHYELRGRMSIDGEYQVLGYADKKESLDEMIEKYSKTWRYLTWDSYRSAIRTK